MATCQLEVNLSGEALDSIGMPTSLLVWGRVVAGQCTKVEFTLRASQGGLVLASGQAETDSNGTWRADVGMPLVTWPCGSHLWVEARCIEGGDCATARSAEVACKLPGGGGGSGPGAQPGGPGSGSDGGPDSGTGGSGDWPWPSPPHIWCPMVGRTFITMLVAALAMILLGAATVSLAVVTAGLALVGAAFAALAFWRQWCVPNWCYVNGALFWVLGRATLAGIGITIGMMSMWAGLWTVIFGALAAAFNIALLRRRCRVPALTTPLAQLPLW
jgi:hypothetical protein